MISVAVKVPDMFLCTVASGAGIVAPTLTAPSGAFTVFRGQTLTLTATHPNAIDRIDWVLNPGPSEVIVATDSSSPFTQSPTVDATWPEGANNLVARAVKGGLRADSAPIVLTVALPHLITQVYFSGTPSFVVPSRLASPGLVDSKVLAQCWAGGCGGTANTNGGAGGAYAEDTVTVTPDATMSSDAVGAGGAAAGNGTDTIFGSTLVVAKAGSGATAAVSGACAGSVIHVGTNGTTGAGNQRGGGGAGSTADASAGVGGAHEGGAGQNATAGRTLGAGGGCSVGSGLVGARGERRLHYYVPGTAGFARRMGASHGRDASATTSRSAVMTGSAMGTIVAGEVLVLVVGVDGASTVSVSGWTQLLGGTITDGTSAVGIAVFWKTAAGGDSATIVTSGSTLTSHSVTRYANAGTPVATSATGNSTNANPPDTGALASGNYHIQAAAALDSASITLTGLPSNYTGGATVYPVGDTGVILVNANRQITGTSENPGTFTSGNEQWAAVTIAIPYAA